VRWTKSKHLLLYPNRWEETLLQSIELDLPIAASTSEPALALAGKGGMWADFSATADVTQFSEPLHSLVMYMSPEF